MVTVLSFLCVNVLAQTQKVTIKVTDAPLSQVIQQIEKQTNYRFSYRDVVLDNQRSVSVDLKEATIPEVLDEALSGSNLSYIILSDRSIVIYSSPASQEDKVSPLMGRVTDSKGQPIIGAGILVEGKPGLGTISDENGNWSLNVSPGTTLQITSMGYEAASVKVDGQGFMNVVLKDDVSQLEDAVVIGYGIVKKSDLTGAVASVKASAFEDRPAATIDALLQGKVAGLQVTQTSAEPGASLQVLLRGISSRQGSNSPLYVVDGFPYGDAGALKQVNVNDIVSIEVLKDASAASIYGSRGANGVIMISTKSGMIDKAPTISVATNTGVQWVNTSNFAIIDDPFVYAMLNDESRVNDTRIGVPKYIGDYDDSGFYFPSLIELQTGTWTNSTYWAKEVLKAAVIQNYNFSVTGGGKSNAYMFSGSYFNQDGTLIGSRYDSYSTRFKFDQNITRNLTLGTNISLGYINRKHSNISYEALFRNPVFPVYAEDGTYYKIDPTDMSNPVMLANEVKNHSDGYDLNTMVYANWMVTKDLTVRAQSGLKLGMSITDKYYPRTTTEGDIHKGRAFLDNYLGTDFLNEIYATYRHLFASRHDLSVMLGYSSEMTNIQGSGLTAAGFANDNLTNENMSMGDPTKNLVTNYKEKETLSSFISRINYTFDNRFLITLTGRFDGSSKFGINNRYGFFPSVAVGWKIAEERFIKDNFGWIDELKLRASYGTTGNQAISVYGTKDKISGQLNDKYYIGNTLVSGLGLTQMGNSSLRWETTTQANVGLDIGIIRNALSLTMDVYDKTTTGLLRQRNLPLSGGIGNHHNGNVGTVWINSGTLNNKGIEFTLNARPISNNDFSWMINATASHNKTMIVDIGEEGESIGLLRSRGSFSDGGVYWRNGEQMDAIVGYEVDGIIQPGETFDYLTGEEALAGEFKYLNLDGDKTLSAGDMKVLGYAQPKWVFGFGTTFYYKGFDLDAQFNGLLGNSIISQKKFSYARQINRWTPDNHSNEYPSLRSGRNVRLSDWWIEDASYVRVSNITLGYTFQPGQLKYIKGLRLFTSCTNPYVFTNFSGIDPEVWIFDGGTYPKPITVSFGVNLDF